MSFVQSSGTLVGLDSRPSYSQYPSFSLRLSEFLAQDYATLYRKQSAVRSVVGFVARNIAQLGLHVYRRHDDDDRQRVRDHRLVDLLSQPVPGAPWMTQYRMIHSLVVDLCVYDWALLFKASDGAGGWSLMRVPPIRFTPLGNGYWPDRFEIRGPQGGRKEIAASEFIFFQGSLGLDDSLMSIPPIESLRELLAEEYEAGRQRQDFWRNGARVSAVIEHPKTLSRPAMDRLDAAFSGKYSRGGTKAGGVPILEEGMTLNTQGTMTSREAQYIESRKLTREEAAAAWHVPPAMAGLTSQAPFASIREQHHMLYQDTLGPWLQMIQQDFNAQVVPDFEDRDGIYVEFNIEEKLRGAFEDQAESLQRAVGGPWMTRNEGRKLRNLPAVDGGDELIVPLNVTTGGQANPLDADGALNPQASSQIVRHLERWANQVKRSGRLDEGRCVRELAADLGADLAAVASQVFALVATAPDLMAGIEDAAASFAAA